MSRVGEQSIQLNETTTVSIDGDIVHIKGAKGEMSVTIPEGINVSIDNNVVSVTRKKDRFKSLHGLMRSLINNAVLGVSKPWEKHLQVTGTGYRVKMEGENVVFEVGFSHPVKFEKIVGVTFSVKGSILTIAGVNKQLVGEVANKIKMTRKPDAYKGKGIRYEGEIIKLKPGKKAKTA